MSSFETQIQQWVVLDNQLKTLNDKAKEIRDIFVQAGRRPAVLDSYRPDFCQSNNQMSDRDIQPWYAKQTQDWRRLTQGVSLK